jgi:hypothetical protein
MKTSLRRVAKPQQPSQPRRNNRPRPKVPSSGRHPRHRFLRLTAGAAAFSAVSRVASGQAFPSRPITIIDTFAAGGATDMTARTVAEPMRAFLGQPIIIENVAGANGNIGTGRAARQRHAFGARARHPDLCRDGTGGAFLLRLEWIFCSQRDFEGHHRQTQCGGRRGIGRSYGAIPAC